MKNLLFPDEFVFYYQMAIKKAPKPATMKKSQYVNYLAIQLLEEMGNDYPSQQEIDLVESLVARYWNKAGNVRRSQTCELDTALANSFI